MRKTKNFQSYLDPEAARDWHWYLEGLDIDQLFANEALRSRAHDLYLENACDIIELEPEVVTAHVHGRTGFYWTRLFLQGSELFFDCDCPSDYDPCKHAGALLYTLSDFSEDDSGGNPEVNHSGLRQGRAGAAGAAGARGQNTEAGRGDYTPGELIDVVDLGDGGRNRFDARSFLFVGDDAEDPAGTVSKLASFRPAFRLVGMSDAYRPIRRVLGIEPVLVYLRKDGADGRLEKFGPGKKRLPGNAAAEQLLKLCLSVEGRTKPAREVFKMWYARALRGGEDRLDFPVELYLDRAWRLEREKRAFGRKIHGIEVRWELAQLRREQIEYEPQVLLRDEEGHEEPFLPEVMMQEGDAEMLLVSNPETGSIWYLFDVDLPDSLSKEMRALAVFFDIPRFFTGGEVRSLAEISRNRFAGFVVVDEVPENVRIVSMVPTPVVDFDWSPYPSGFGPAADEEETALELAFRYADGRELAPGGEDLIPISAEEARMFVESGRKGDSASDVGTSKAETGPPVTEETARDVGTREAETGPPVTKGAGENTEPGTRSFILPNKEIEEHFLSLLASIAEEAGYPLLGDVQGRVFLDRIRSGGYPRGWAEPGIAMPPRFYLTGELYETAGALIGRLVERGFEVRLKKEKVRRPPGTRTVRVASSGEEWLDIESGFETEEGFIPIEKVHARGLVEAHGQKYILPPGTDVERIIPLLRSRRIGRRDLAALEEIAGEVSNPEHPAIREYAALREKLSSFAGLEEAGTPPSFKGELRPYQRNGLSWLRFLHSYGLGGCLADDMGLGKTIQALALLAGAREAGEMRRALVVCPVSTLGNWRREAADFTPHFATGVHAGQDRPRSASALDELDIVFVGYATLQRDIELFREAEFDYLILDEAQAIKNPHAKRRKAIASLDIPHRLALTGTPVENSMAELWSLLDILMPGILGSRSTFSKRYGRDVEDQNGIERLRRIIRPLILRRTKKAVAPELPPKEELVHRAEMGRHQAQVYESLRLRFVDEVEGLIREGGRGRAGMKILEAMLRLRQAAILPALVDRDFAEVPSAKMDVLYDRLIELRDEGNKALVFSQFTGVLDEAELRLSASGLSIFRLDGSTPRSRRERDIDGFQQVDGGAVFLISLKAGGVGINLTAADYVFLLDPWWNPAVESQAIDRAHRIGREGSVFAYRLVTVGTIEEKMLRLQEKKRRLSENLIRGESGALRELSNEDILGLFR